MVLGTRFVTCPKLELHRRLQEAAKASQAYHRLPVPLILAGWAHSNDVEKRTRWQETLAWTNHHGLGALLSDITDDSMHVGSELRLADP
jgi:hypothetical protein